MPPLSAIARRFALAASTAAALLATPIAAGAEPAMWVIKDADSTIYLLGSMHALKPDLVWQTPKITDALKSAKELWLEVPGMPTQEQAMAEMQPLLLQKGLARDKLLSSLLTPDEMTLVTKKLTDMGMPAQAVPLLRPWVPALVLMGGSVTRAGLAGEAGVEMTLQKVAKDEGDAIKGFESLSQQVNIFADLPEATQVELLRATLQKPAEQAAALNGISDAWAAGDLAALETLVVGPMKSSPVFYDVLLVKRNAAWTSQIKTMLAGSGVSFIAVGAGHLVGADSVVAMLKTQGVEALRY